MAKAKVTDFTGRQREELLKANAEEVAKRAAEMSIASQVEAERLDRKSTRLNSSH